MILILKVNFFKNGIIIHNTIIVWVILLLENPLHNNALGDAVAGGGGEGGGEGEDNDGGTRGSER